jgi:hypothetical protein
VSSLKDFTGQKNVALVGGVALNRYCTLLRCTALQSILHYTTFLIDAVIKHSNSSVSFSSRVDIRHFVLTSYFPPSPFLITFALSLSTSTSMTSHPLLILQPCPILFSTAVTVTAVTVTAVTATATTVSAVTAAVISVLNGRISRELGFDKTFVPPGPGDEGIAVGCALYGLQVQHV